MDNINWQTILPTIATIIVAAIPGVVALLKSHGELSLSATQKLIENLQKDVDGLREENRKLRAEYEQRIREIREEYESQIDELRSENRALRDRIRKLEGKPPRPIKRGFGDAI